MSYERRCKTTNFEQQVHPDPLRVLHTISDRSPFKHFQCIQIPSGTVGPIANSTISQTFMPRYAYTRPEDRAEIAPVIHDACQGSKCLPKGSLPRLLPPSKHIVLLPFSHTWTWPQVGRIQLRRLQLGPSGIAGLKHFRESCVAKCAP